MRAEAQKPKKRKRLRISLVALAGIFVGTVIYQLTPLKCLGIPGYYAMQGISCLVTKDLVPAAMDVN